MWANHSLYGGPRKMQPLQPTVETLRQGTCTMITSTQSDRLKCPYQLTYARVGPINQLSVDILPSGECTNTGNAFPMTDGWVIFDFDPTISDVFPTKGTSDWSLPEIVIPRISEYITFSEGTRTLADGCWVATLHPEEAISLSHRTSVDFFENGETWQIKQAIRFPISSV